MVNKHQEDIELELEKHKSKINYDNVFVIVFLVFFFL